MIDPSEEKAVERVAKFLTTVGSDWNKGHELGRGLRVPTNFDRETAREIVYMVRDEMEPMNTTRRLI